MRSFNLLTFFILSSVATHLCHAGVITASPDGKPTKWVSDAGTTYDLYEDSFYDAFLSNYDDNVIFDFSETEATNLASALAQDANISDLPPRDFVILFAQESSGDFITASYVYYFSNTSSWYSTITNIPTTAHSFQGLAVLWAATSANSQNPVPEPSTAIAMGLLGVLGFAGNRRRRLQS